MTGLVVCLHNKPQPQTTVAFLAQAIMSTQELSTSQTEDDNQVISPTNVGEPLLPENEDNNSTETRAMEERKAKLEQLRARMVIVLLAAPGTMFIVPSFISGRPREQTGNHSLRNLQKPKSQRGMPHGLNGKRNWPRCCGHKQRLRPMGRTSNVQRTGSGR